MTEALMSSGRRITPQRLAIVKVLARDADHPSAEAIFRQLTEDFPTMSLATVYKTVLLLKELDQLQEVRTDSIHARYDGQNPEPHIHVVCRNCQHVIDLPTQCLDGLMQRVEDQADCHIISHNLVFYAICSHCGE
jgi:Fur family peroxide stress response transcriptional regulator